MLLMGGVLGEVIRQRSHSSEGVFELERGEAVALAGGASGQFSFPAPASKGRGSRIGGAGLIIQATSASRGGEAQPES